MSPRRINIAIDGHASAGKSTMAKALARELNFIYIDTGAMYRAATLFAIKERLVSSDGIREEALIRALDRMFIRFKYNPVSEESEIHLGNMNVEKEIRTMGVSKYVSPISTVAAVREKLANSQRRLASAGGVVMDGRDIGTVVLPDAPVKFFITATPEVRAKRRLKELETTGTNITFEDVLKNVTERDRIDSTRGTAPLKQADDAIVLDNSDLTVEEQFKFLLTQTRRRMENSG